MKLTDNIKKLRDYCLDGANEFVKYLVSNELVSVNDFFIMVAEELVYDNNRRVRDNKAIYEDVILFNRVCDEENKQEFKIHYKKNKKNRYSFWV